MRPLQLQVYKHFYGCTLFDCVTLCHCYDTYLHKPESFQDCNTGQFRLLEGVQ